jgi:endonuclease YncB( thermonuclease family)
MGNCKSSNQSIISNSSQSSVGRLEHDNDTIFSNVANVDVDIDNSSITSHSKFGCFSLENVDLDQIQLFSFEGIDTLCKVVDAYDGDTCTVVFIHPTFQHAIKTKVRCLGYDSPEMKLPKISDLGSKQEIKKMVEERNKKKELAIAARDRLLELCTQNTNGVRIVFGKNDKYGRPLATFYLDDGRCINNIMIKEKHGYAYYGGKKRC